MAKITSRGLTQFSHHRFDDCTRRTLLVYYTQQRESDNPLDSLVHDIGPRRLSAPITKVRRGLHPHYYLLPASVVPKILCRTSNTAIRMWQALSFPARCNYKHQHSVSKTSKIRRRSIVNHLLHAFANKESNHQISVQSNGYSRIYRPSLARGIPYCSEVHLRLCYPRQEGELKQGFPWPPPQCITRFTYIFRNTCAVRSVTRFSVDSDHAQCHEFNMIYLG